MFNIIGDVIETDIKYSKELTYKNTVSSIMVDGINVGELEYIFDSEDCIYLNFINILVPYRKKGIAKKVIEALNEDYNIVGDSVMESVGFWEKVGATLDEKSSSDTCVPFILS